MENESVVSMQVGKDVVEKIVKAKIEAAVVAALSQESTMIEKAVALCLGAKVDSAGNYTSSEYQVAGTLLEVLARNAIIDATRDALKTWCAENKPSIEKNIRDYFNKHNKALAEAFFSGMKDSLESTYHVNISFKSPDHR